MENSGRENQKTKKVGRLPTHSLVQIWCMRKVMREIVSDKTLHFPKMQDLVGIIVF